MRLLTILLLLTLQLSVFSQVNLNNNTVTIDAQGVIYNKYGQRVNVTTINSATYQTLGTEQILHVTRTSTGACTITLDTDDLDVGKVIIIKDAGGLAGSENNNITIETEGAETIDGANTQTISVNYGSIQLYSNGSNWFIY